MSEEMMKVNMHEDGEHLWIKGKQFVSLERFAEVKKCGAKLSDIETDKLHYVKVPENHIVIDFDIKDENGNKSFERNLIAANKWFPTYAELSKSGGGIHLHYIYRGDVNFNYLNKRLKN